MSTVLADFRSGVMVADTGASDGDRQWPDTRKVWRVRNCLLGFAGNYDEITDFLSWKRGGAKPKFNNSFCLELSPKGLWLYDKSPTAVPVESGREAIGSGAKGAMCAYEALGWERPRKAVQIACRYDALSRAPVRSYKI